MKKTNAIAIVSLLLFGTEAVAQSSPNLITGQVPTAAQWNSYFQRKQDVLNYTPINSAGGVFTGKVTTAPSSASGSGLNVSPGTAPSLPANGDVWTTTAGMYVRINGVTIGPLSSGAAASFAATNPLTVSFPSSVTTYACPTCAVTTGPLSQFATTTSAQLASVLSDETGTGPAVFGTAPAINNPTIVGGTYSGMTSLGILASGGGGFNVILADTEALTANRSLFFRVNDASRLLDLGGSIAISGDLSVTGSFAATLALTGATNVTLPTTGTLATRAGAEALTNKTYNGNTWTAGTGTLTLGAGKTLTASNTLTLTGTDGSTAAFGAGGTVAYLANTLNAFAATTSAQLATVISDETGTGALVFGTNPVLTTPNLGTPSAVVLTNATGLPLASVTGLGTGCATWLATPSSANLRGCLTDEVGTGAAYFVGGALGTPASATLTNGTGLPTTGLTGTLQAAQFPALTGDVTTVAGALASTIANSAVTNAKMATMTTGTVKANVSGSTGAPGDVSVNGVLENVLGTTQGSIAYRNASTWTFLPPGTSGQMLQTAGAAANVGWSTTVYPASGTSGGIPYYSSTTTIASSAALTQYGLIYGGGAGAAPVAAAAMTNGQIMVGQTGAAPVPRTMSGDCTFAASGAITCSASGGRIKLTGNANYYVNDTGGSDSNDCLTGGTPCKTVQGAYNKLIQLDFNAYNVTVNVADGNYTTPFVAIQPQTGGGILSMVGNTTTPANVVMNATANNMIDIQNGARITINGMELRTTTSGYCIKASNYAVVTFGPNMRFGSAGSGHMQASAFGKIITSGGGYVISGGANYHLLALAQGQIELGYLGTVTLSGTPAFAVAFAYAGNLSLVSVPGITWSGAATGVRYIGLGNAVIDTNGSGASYLPGNAAGSVSTGAQYL